MMRKYIIFSIFVAIYKKSCDYAGFMSNSLLFSRKSLKILYICTGFANGIQNMVKQTFEGNLPLQFNVICYIKSFENPSLHYNVILLQVVLSQRNKNGNSVSSIDMLPINGII